MSRHWLGKPLWIGISVAAILLAVGVVILATRPLNSDNNNTNTVTSANRERYAALYDAAWRQDDGKDTTLVTATLFVPPTIELLGTDVQRSTTEDQLWNVIKSLPAATVPIVLTFDSLTGFISDEAIKKSLELKADNGQTLTLQNWQTLIAPSRVVNTSGTSSQVGVVLFSSDQDIDWQKIGTLTLTVKGIGGTAERVFTWTEPKLLLDL